MLRDLLDDRVTVSECSTIPRAVECGFAQAVAGDVVLLSPGCASFDQYGSFIERGEEFRRAVGRLEPREASDA
jgi:UDP-N-acetylmuramoylalanine--D-glutamate ligase